MSNIYITEPPTSGKVLLYTSVGDIDIELWAKETPKTCRNFVQLCMEGYYNNTIFHRVVPDFIVQGGDPTGTGTGGESIYGKPFKDELHSRLRFNRRGLVAMANSGPNDNGSQFFFTLGPTPELNNKHTIFGKIAGNTLYNMIKLVEGEIGQDERPVYPHKINKTKILSNPFTDIEVRKSSKQLKEEKAAEDDAKKKQSKSKATKNFSLLSFGEEAEEEEVVVKKVNQSMKSKSKSSHDLLQDSKLSSQPALESKDDQKMKKKPKAKEEKLSELTDSSEEEENIEAKKERIREKFKQKKEENPSNQPVKRKEPSTDFEESRKEKSLEELKREAKKLKREILASKQKEKGEPIEEEESLQDTSNEVDIADGLQAFKANRQKYKKQQKSLPRKGSDREAQTLALLAKFQSKLNTAKQFAEYGTDSQEEDKDDNEQRTEDEDDDATDMSWLSHRLKFDQRDKKVLDANVADEERYEIYDPRNPLNQRRREASKAAMKESKSSKKGDKL